ncbi:Cytochrome P450 monooxygenase apf8 [Paramyrothecium foliicola]|nr:Cytochrome P450 monooxygenase apf8 [Paramyrothecium foliicola]
MTPIGTVFDTPEIDQHRRKRKIISQAISEKAMRTFEPTLAEQVRTHIRQLLLACRRAEAVDMTKQYEYLGGDVVGHLAFGYPLNMQLEETNRWLMWALSFVSVRINIYMQFPRTAIIEPMVKILGHSIREKYRSIIEKMIRNRIVMPKDAKHDLYAFAVDSMGGGASIRGNELWAEAFLFIVAGGATTATSMAALCFYLSRHPDCYKKLSEEIRSKFGSGKEIRAGPQLQECKYLRACINEALRLSPPAPGMLWREQVPAKAGEKEPSQLVVDGVPIPRGTHVAVNLYALHHNEDYFTDPFKFKPERWLSPEAEDPSSLMRRAFAPFSIGSRSCAGKAVAYLEISLALASTLFYFDFEAAPGKEGQIGAGSAGRTDGRDKEDEYQLYEIFTAFHKGPLLTFKERKGFCDDI